MISELTMWIENCVQIGRNWRHELCFGVNCENNKMLAHFKKGEPIEKIENIIKVAYD